MTPAARLSAAIEILDRILAGAPAEQALTNWGRANRFAGSGDRHALRDLVYDALRCKRSFAALGGGETGRGLILGGLRDRDEDVEGLFNGEAHAPAPIGPADAGICPVGAAALDCPDWLLSKFETSHPGAAEAILKAFRLRAPVFLRVNLARTTLASAQASLAAETIQTCPHPLASTALEVTVNARKIQNSVAFAAGLVELQDVASQAVVETLPLRDGMRVLDYCAGGGGKSLAMAARAKMRLFAHDADPRRMRDIPVRAKRAGIAIGILENIDKKARYDLILLDAPCSGSGSWRRDPQGKWALTATRLDRIREAQADILNSAAPLVGPQGVLAYVTCSVFEEENEAQIQGFLSRNLSWRCKFQKRFSPLDGGDGFFVALLTVA